MLHDDHPKFIITKGYDLILGHFSTHESMKGDALDSDVLGGGWWKREGKTLYLYGTSIKYNHVNLETVRKAITLTPSPSIQSFTVMFSLPKGLVHTTDDAVKVHPLLEFNLKENLILLDTLNRECIDIRCDCGKWKGFVPTDDWKCKCGIRYTSICKR